MSFSLDARPNGQWPLLAILPVHCLYDLFTGRHPQISSDAETNRITARWITNTAGGDIFATIRSLIWLRYTNRFLEQTGFRRSNCFFLSCRTPATCTCTYSFKCWGNSSYFYCVVTWRSLDCVKKIRFEFVRSSNLALKAHRSKLGPTALQVWQEKLKLWPSLWQSVVRYFRFCI